MVEFKMGVGGYNQINRALNVDAFEDYLEAQLRHIPEISSVEKLSPRVVRVLGQNPGKVGDSALSLPSWPSALAQACFVIYLEFLHSSRRKLMDLLLDQFTLQGTNTYIIGMGSSRLIIDTGQGIPAWADTISKTLKELDIRLTHVLLTHWHGDHTGGFPDLIRLYPHLSTAIYKNSPCHDQLPITNGQVFRVEGATIRALHTPGHSRDHMCFILEEENAMFTGDNILGHGTTAVEELGTYMASLRVMQDECCTLGYPAHGVLNSNLETKIAGELAQKKRREVQVLRALGKLKVEKEQQIVSGGGGRKAIKSATISALVTSMHGQILNHDVRVTALEPFMEEVLKKLAEDGEVAFEIRQGVKRWFKT